MRFQHAAQLVDFRRRHAFGGQAAGGAFQRFADFVEFGEFLAGQRHHPGAGMGHAHQQPLAFQAMQGLAQRTAADAVDARQLGLGNLAAGGDLPLDDGGLDLAEDVVRQGFADGFASGGAIGRLRARQGEHFAHGVDNSFR